MGPSAPYVAPDRRRTVSETLGPGEIFERAAEEGKRRLEQSTVEMVSTGFIAGFTIVFGLVALGMVEALVPDRFGGLERIAGALAFATGLVFLVVGRTELFNENFFDPVAHAVEHDGSWLLGPLLRLWSVTFVFNLIGGVLFARVFAVEGVIPAGSADVLALFAHEMVHRTMTTMFANGIVGGALVSLLSYLLVCVDTTGSRIALSYTVGFLLALGPFDHVIVTVLHVVLGMFLGAQVGLGSLAGLTVIVVAGNLVGGLGLVTFTHATQAIGARRS